VPLMDALELRTPLAHPPSTISTMTPEEIASCTVPEQSKPNSSDMLIMFSLRRKYGNAMRQAALFPEQKNGWNRIEWRIIWCDRSIWDVLFGIAELKKELERAGEEGRETRKVIMVRWRGANHFVSSP
jgi:hypothetical protein